MQGLKISLRSLNLLYLFLILLAVGIALEKHNPDIFHFSLSNYEKSAKSLGFNTKQEQEALLSIFHMSGYLKSRKFMEGFT